MPYCAKCGSEATGNFCPSCGAPIAAPAGPPPSSAPPPIGQPVLDMNMAAALCYFAGAITGVLFLVLEPYNRDKTIRFHAFQSIFASLVLFACGMVLRILAFLPFIGLLFIFVIGFLLPLTTIALWIILMYKAYNRERLVLPIIGPLAEKQA